MKNIQNIGANLERQLIRAFALLDAWFDADDAESNHVRDLLESIVRQNQQLLNRISDELLGESAYVKQDTGYGLLPPHHADCAVGDARDVYNVSRDNGTEDTRDAMDDLRRELRSQLEFCLEQLDALRNSEGPSDHRIAAVQSLMNLDIYQYIRCIMQITRRGYEGISEAGGRKL
jgi:hypothetical protein